MQNVFRFFKVNAAPKTAEWFALGLGAALFVAALFRPTNKLPLP
tara:strand:+ start:1746 stop:1877 length:132 start_codon:yes stop_codon:yes gene_type:complete